MRRRCDDESVPDIVARFDAAAGAAGDMALGALLDAGASLAAVRGQLDALALDGWRLGAEPVRRGGLGGTRAVVEIDGERPPRERPYGEIRDLLAAAPLTEGTRARAQRIFAVLASAEARVHRIAPDDVHFHEVGALDAIVDVVGTAAALDALGVTAATCGPVVTGFGTTSSEHGAMPVPAPAVVELLRGAGAPFASGPIAGEWCTPTGAAILVATCEAFGAAPPMVARAVGYGAGRADPPGRANLLRVTIGDAVADDDGEPAAAEFVAVEATVDDLPGELVPDALAAAMVAGALDAWAVPAIGRKGRPALVVTALAPATDRGAVEVALLTATTTVGVRSHPVARRALARREARIEIGGQPVGVKVALLDGRAVHAKPEHDDCARAAAALGRTTLDVTREAAAAALASLRDGGRL